MVLCLFLIVFLLDVLLDVLLLFQSSIFVYHMYETVDVLEFQLVLICTFVFLEDKVRKNVLFVHLKLAEKLLSYNLEGHALYLCSLLVFYAEIYYPVVYVVR